MTPVLSPEQARAKLGAQRCPTCGHATVVRRRSLNSTMARQLIALYQYFTDPTRYPKDVGLRDGSGFLWVHAKYYLEHRGLERECAKLRFWNMIEERPVSKKDGNPHSGYFRITIYGVEFATEVRLAYKYVLTVNDNRECLGLVGPTISIRQALGNKFNYTSEIKNL